MLILLAEQVLDDRNLHGSLDVEPEPRLPPCSGRQVHDRSTRVLAEGSVLKAISLRASAVHLGEQSDAMLGAARVAALKSIMFP